MARKNLNTEQEIKLTKVLADFVVNGYTFVGEIPVGSPFAQAEDMLVSLLNNLNEKIKNDGERSGEQDSNI